MSINDDINAIGVKQMIAQMGQAVQQLSVLYLGLVGEGVPSDAAVALTLGFLEAVFRAQTQKPPELPEDGE